MSCAGHAAAVGTALAADELAEFAERAVPQPRRLRLRRAAGVLRRPDSGADLRPAAPSPSLQATGAAAAVLACVRLGGLGMRLDGSLEDFSLPDILQLLTHTQKTGSLQLHAADDERHGLVRLASGAVNGASSDLRRHALARRLVGAGLVSDEALSAAAEDVRAGAPSLVRALLDRATSPPTSVTRLAADQVTDAVCELLRWYSGTFSFLVGEPDPEASSSACQAEDLVAEASAGCRSGRP